MRLLGGCWAGSRPQQVAILPEDVFFDFSAGVQLLQTRQCSFDAIICHGLAVLEQSSRGRDLTSREWRGWDRHAHDSSDCQRRAERKMAPELKRLDPLFRPRPAIGLRAPDLVRDRSGVERREHQGEGDQPNRGEHEHPW